MLGYPKCDVSASARIHFINGSLKIFDKGVRISFNVVAGQAVRRSWLRPGSVSSCRSGLG